MERLILSQFLQFSRLSWGLSVLLLGGGLSADAAFPVTPRRCRTSPNPNGLLAGAPGAALGPGQAEALLPHQAPKWRLRPCLWSMWGCSGALAVLSPSPHRSAPASLYRSSFWLLYGWLQLSDANTYSRFFLLKFMFLIQLISVKCFSNHIALRISSTGRGMLPGRGIHNFCSVSRTKMGLVQLRAGFGLCSIIL